MRRALILSLGLAILLGAPSISAQVPNLNLAVKLVEARKANAALAQQYQWNCRTELVEQEEVKDVRIELFQYGPNGQVQRTLINDQPSGRLPIRFLRRAIAEGQRQQVEQFITGLRDLLDQYTLPSAGKVLDFMSSATVQFTQSPDGKPLLEIQGSGVIVPGDTLSMWLDASTYKMTRIQIATTYKGDVANVNGTYKTLAASGLNYLSMAEVTVPAKKMSLQVQNYDYEQNE